ncbi:MAG: SRPBCC family protein [Xanthobacteraceae bacterium]
MNEQTGTADREIVLTRVYDAPRDLVWTAWTDPKHVVHWWGPNGFTNTIHEMDVRPGGVWRFIMHGPDGRDYKNRINFIEVKRPERLVYTHGGDDDVEPVNFHVTVTFEDQGGRTKVTLRSVFPTAEERDRVVKEYGAIEGGRQTLARLADYLATM